MWKKIDFLSPNITLYYREEDKHSSILSTFLSVILFGVIIFSMYLLSFDFLYKKNPVAFYYIRYIEDIGTIYFNNSGMFHIVYLTLKNSNDDPNINFNTINIIGVEVDEYVFRENSNLSQYNHWIYHYCDSKDVEKYANIMEKNTSYNNLCINSYYDKETKTIIKKNDKNFVYPSIQHGAGHKLNTYYGIYVIKCQNTPYNNNSCENDENQNQEINRFSGYIIKFIDFVVDVNNYKFPLQPYFHSIGNGFNPNFFAVNHLNFHPFTLTTNEGIILDSINHVSSYKFDLNEKVTHSTNQMILGSFNFWFQNTLDCYDRTYKKIQDIAGALEGIIEVIMLFVRLINSVFLNDYQTIRDFNNEIEIKVNKKKKLMNSSSIPKNHKILNVFDQTQSQKISKKKTFDLLKNNYILSNIEIYRKPTKIEKNFKKIKWLDLILGVRFRCKKNYISYIEFQRKKIISEEMLINHYIIIKKLKDVAIKDFAEKKFRSYSLNKFINENYEDSKNSNLALISNKMNNSLNMINK